MSENGAVQGGLFGEVPAGYRATDATLSECGRYRYALWRWWGEPGAGRTFTVIGLNPSTADARQDDPTIRRCVGFAKREGCTGLLMLNLFAFRATDPRELRKTPDPIGPANDLTLGIYVEAGLAAGAPVVAAWGTHGTLYGRDAAVSARFPGLVCLGRSKGGHPRHPLYLAADTPLEPLTSAERSTEAE